MSGLVKAKKYDWKDSNMALFGSDTEKEVKKESAESEPAWQGVGQEEGLKIWRIESFEVKEWDGEVGKFYNGDSYIILNTYKDDDSDQLLYDVHFWIGKNSTQDEYGTAAYKTVELDTFLDDAAVQHREVQGHESNLFKSYFPKGLTTMEGGAASGFRHVTPEEYKPRLLKFNGKGSNITVREVPLSKNTLNSNDVFILDLGEKFIQYNGSGCSAMEKSKAMQYMGDLKNERGSSDDLVLDEGDDCDEFLNHLNEDDVEGDSDDEDADGEQLLSRLNGDEFEEVKSGDVSMDDFQSDDVFLFETPNGVYVWVGCNASCAEKKNGLPRAHQYLKSRDRFSSPVTVIKEGQKSKDFQSAIAA